MLVAGLTGGLACGKSFVARAFKDLGCDVIEADELGHEVMRPGGPAWQPIVDQFGKQILQGDGMIDRSRLATIVFSDPAQLEKLNAIVHPAVQVLTRTRFRELAERDPHAIGIYVAAILVETGAYKEFAKLIVVTCSTEQQIARAMERGSGNKKDILARIARQLPAERKTALADYVIDTGGAIEATLRQTKMVFEDLRKLNQ